MTLDVAAQSIAHDRAQILASLSRDCLGGIPKLILDTDRPSRVARARLVRHQRHQHSAGMRLHPQQRTVRP
jgi:hypothetical protein